MNISKIFRILMWVAFITCAVSFFFKNQLPPPERIDVSLKEEPLQEITDQKAFSVNRGGVVYNVQPKYSYDLRGLVVSEHSADTLFDYYHKRWGDVLNVKDICVVWGDNVSSGVYNDISFKNGSWTCYAKTDSNQAFAKFRQDQFSNNHLLAGSDKIKKALNSINEGDQVRIVGYLSEYSHGDFLRGTSVVRTDTGNGACETIFVTGVEILRRATPWWLNIYKISYVMFFVLLVVRITLYVNMVRVKSNSVVTYK